MMWVDGTLAADVDSEMQVRRCRPRVAAVANRADLAARIDPCALLDVLCLEVREVQMEIALAIVQPDDAAAELPVIDATHPGPRCSTNGGVSPREDIDAVMLASPTLSGCSEAASDGVGGMSIDGKTE